MTKILASLLLLVVLASILASCSCPCNDEPIPEPTPAPTVNERLDTIDTILRSRWPDPDGSDEQWYTDLYNRHTPFEYDWGSRGISGLSALILVDGAEHHRAKILTWREGFADINKDIERRLATLPESDNQYEALRTVHFRFSRIIDNVDAILETPTTP